MLFQKSQLNAHAVRPLVARSGRQNPPRPSMSNPVRQFGTTSNSRNAVTSTTLVPVLQRLRGSFLSQNPTASITRLNNQTRTRFHTATADSFYPLPSNTPLFGEFFRPNTTSYYGSTTNPTLTTYTAQTQQNEPETPWEDFTLYDEDGPAGEFSWDVASFAPALFAPLAEVFASAISNPNESKAADAEQDEENAFVPDEPAHPYERQ